MPLQSSFLCRVPCEVLEEISVNVALLDAPVGPPTALVPLLLTCKHLYNTLGLHSCSDVYARIFRGSFDCRAARRRLGEKAVRPSHLAAQLKRNFATLRRIRAGNLVHDELEEDLWAVWLMCLENDGKNELQLDWAGVDDFLVQFLRTRLWHARETYDNWPAEFTINALAIWIYWYRLDEGKLATLNSETRKLLLDRIRPYALAAPRYASFLAPDNHFCIPLPRRIDDEYERVLVTPHGWYPQYREPSMCVELVEHFGLKRELSPPLIAQGAKLLYISLSEMPFTIDPALPVNREHAMQMGRNYVNPTQTDLIEANAHKAVKLIGRGDPEWTQRLTEEQRRLEDDGAWRKGLKAISAALDEEWNRMVGCGNPYEIKPKGPTYAFGTLTGLWKGLLLVPDTDQYFALVNSARLPASFSSQNPLVVGYPMYANLREHHCIMPEMPIMPGGSEDENDDGISNAWFPHCRIREAGGFVTITDEEHGFVSRYETFVEGRDNSHNPETCTACIRERELDEVEERERIEEIMAAAASNAEYPDDDTNLVRVRKQVDAALGPNTDADELIDTVMSEVTSDDASSLAESDGCIENTCSGITDIAITGETLPRHGQAWHHFYFYGRVRSWDGLVAIVRVPMIPQLGVYIFRGYIVAGNFVGSWRLRTNHVRAIPLEGPFVMSKV
ncbi:uncharacterized protein LAESUDRAFT_651186 [Laetiporus sulphureus 93-53]|uniref:F-box domain-containing protein n=1 Tax=Laetiporus sulphureus 93-53 TaxID=1314785 RepID=A0A165EQ96_9APHY|nr:uncharacterized protein LAESUDRAFT_651186 [Laetiporus sulphureus 93-53]KZT07539.1 hypothetical protein LAESUDRAFT_651186 [Laetiporus sulphureus 93-53]